MENIKRVSRNTVKKIVTPLFNESPVFINKITNGNIYKVYKVVLKDAGYMIVRVSLSSEKINQFLKEQWCTKEATKKGIPIPEILEVGNTIIPNPYMVVREANGIPGNLYEGDRTTMIEEMGKYAKMINSIPTEGYGEFFNWSHNVLSKNNSWEDYLEKEFKLEEIVKFFEEHEILSSENQKKFLKYSKEIKKLDFKPTLAHGDLLPKNVIVNKEGHIVGIFDWEASQSTHAMLWELATSLNNITDEEKEVFVKGYGMSLKEFHELWPIIDTLYLLKKSDMVIAHTLNNEPELLNILKVRFEKILNKHK